MKALLLAAIAAATFALSACQQEKVAPAPPIQWPLLEIRLTQVGATPYVNVAQIGYNLTTPVGPKGRGPNIHWQGEFKEGTQYINAGRPVIGAMAWLYVRYTKGGNPGYPTPGKGDYLECEVFANGKSQRTLRLTNAYFNPAQPNPTCHHFTDADGTHVYDIINVTLVE